MTNRKMKFLWISCGTAGIFLLLTILIFFLPKLLNLEAVKAKIRTDISRNVGGRVEFQRIDLSVFPRPLAIIHQMSLSIPDKFSCNVKFLKAYPKIFSLFTGRIQIAEIRLEAPDIRIELTDQTGENRKNTWIGGFEEIEKKTASWLVLAASKTPGLTIRVHQGKLDLVKKDQPVLWFRNVHARLSLPSNKLRARLTCQSNAWKKISLEGQLEPMELKSNGKIRVTRLQPQVIMDSLFPTVTPRVGESKVDLNLDFSTQGPGTVHATLHGSIPSLTLIQKEEKSVVRGKNLKGIFDLRENRVNISLPEMELDYPRLNLSGNLSLDRDFPRIRLEVKGRNIDVDSTRQTVLALLGNFRIVQEIFEIIKGGEIPDIVFNAQGNSADELRKIENLRIKGNIREGKLDVPGLQLSLQNVHGEASIFNGILNGKNLEGQMGNSRAHHGTLRLGLAGNDAPFRLETAINADLAQLPPILKRLVDNQTFLEELALIEDLEGKGEGRLEVKKSQDRINTNVAVRKFNLSTRYQRIFWPLEIDQGTFSYDENRISAANLVGRLGKSSFSKLSVWLDRKENNDLKVLSGKATVSLEEIHPWLSSFERIKDHLLPFRIVQGTLNLKNLELTGPSSSPKDWQFQITGEMKNLFIDSSFFRFPLTVAHGGFQMIPAKLSFTDASMRILDSSIMVSGHLNYHREGLRQIESALSGDLGPESIEYISNTIGLSHELRLLPPLTISNAKLLWDTNAETSFSGNMEAEDGPMLSIDITRNPERLTIRNLLIRDEKSRATLNLVLTDKAFDLGFTGNLKKSTLETLLKKNRFLGGWIEGDFRLRVLMDQLTVSLAQGTLQGADLYLPWKFKEPLEISRFSLESEKNEIKLNRLVIAMEQSIFTLEGNASLSGQAIFLDLDLFCDHFDWDNGKKFTETVERTGNGDRTKTSFWELPLEGVLRTRFDSFRYEGFTWTPFGADIFFSGNEIRLETKKAELCGINTPGILKISPGKIQLDFKPVAENSDLDSALNCLWNRKDLAHGNFNFEGHVFTQAQKEVLIQNLQGEMELAGENGRIYRFGLLAKIFALLNVTEIISGNLPDLSKEGFAYNFLNIKADLRNGRLGLKEAVIDSPSLEVVFKGDVDLTDKELDLTVLIAPFRTVDRIIKHIPLLKDVLQGNLIAIPVRVTGNWEDPRITPLSPSAVTSEVLGIMKRTLKLPVKIIQPLIKE